MASYHMFPYWPSCCDAATSICGAEIIITEDGQPLVKLSHAATPKPRPQFGSARGLITIPDDFDEPLEDFNKYLQ